MSSKNLNKVSESVSPANTSVHMSKTTKELAKEKLEEFMKEELKLVKGMFQCFETPGSSQKIVVRKYKGHVFEKVMTDGMIYEIPLYVARHLNGVDVTAGALGDPNTKNTAIGTCSYPVHGFRMASQSAELNPSMLGSVEGHGGIPVPIVGIAKRVKRYGFQSMEFAGA